MLLRHISLPHFSSKIGQRLLQLDKAAMLIQELALPFLLSVLLIIALVTLLVFIKKNKDKND
ncbi:MAG: hypothetical protein WAX77_13860 [Methylococcaceae bacterium]